MFIGRVETLQGFCATECEAAQAVSLLSVTQSKAEILQGLARKDCCIIECERGRGTEEREECVHNTRQQLQLGSSTF